MAVTGSRRDAGRKRGPALRVHNHGACAGAGAGAGATAGQELPAASRAPPACPGASGGHSRQPRRLHVSSTRRLMPSPRVRPTEARHGEGGRQLVSDEVGVASGAPSWSPPWGSGRGHCGHHEPGAVRGCTRDNTPTPPQQASSPVTPSISLFFQCRGPGAKPSLPSRVPQSPSVPPQTLSFS